MSEPRSFAHYTVADKIGAGGMGEVFRATDNKLNRDVALKMLPDAVAQDAERLARFRREAQVLAALNHPGIAGIYGLESEGENFALAMELVSGPDLSERLEQGPLSVEEGLQVALELADAVEAAHEKGIVHRDLKPANIKINDEGRVKVLDFGLAKALASDSGVASSIDPAMSPTLTANMTMGNVILGTAAYMSPEQARGTEVDKRADIWSFGVVVVEMLGGHRLFAGETVSDTLASVLKEAIDLDSLPEELPKAVKKMLARCLNRDPRQRLRDMGDARIILQEAISGEIDDEPELVSGAPVKSQTQWFVTAALVVASLAAMYFFMPQSETTLVPLRKFSVLMDTFDSSMSTGFSPTISPNGKHLAYLSDSQLWVRNLDALAAYPLPGTDGAHVPFWSPDSEWLGFATNDEMKKVARSGGQSTTLATFGEIRSPGSASSGVWNDDGSIYFSNSVFGLFETSAQASAITTLLSPGEDEIDFHEMCALPDGRGWVFVVHAAESYGNLALLTPDGQIKSLLNDTEDAISTPVWSPSGHLLFERENVSPGLWAAPFSLDELAFSGEPFLIAAGAKLPSVSDDGTLAYVLGVHTAQADLSWYARDGEFISTIAQVQTTRPFPSLSPDDTKVALSAKADNGRPIWIFDTSNGNERRLNFDDQLWGEAVWHPDGQHIITYVDPNFDAFLLTLDGSAEPRALGKGALSRITHDGRTWLSSMPALSDGFNFDIHSRPLDAPEAESRAMATSTHLEWAPTPSPNDKFMIYVSDESGQQEIYATTLPNFTGRWQVSRGGGGWAQWSGDGKEIFYCTHREMFVVAVDYTNGFTLGRPQKLFDRPSTDWSEAWPDGFDVTADGQRFVMLRPVVDGDSAQPKLVVVQNWFSEFGGK